MIAVRVTRPFGLWNAGETAGFPPERAAELIEQGFAERVEAVEAASEPPARKRTKPAEAEASGEGESSGEA